jgi:phosphohistidine phosphatase
MLLYLLRHGIAEDHGSRASDDERELTDEGRIKTRAVMSAAKKIKLVPPELVISSPLIRAKQTAEIALDVFAKGAKSEISDAITPSSEMMKTMALVAERAKKFTCMMLVGHEPHLSHFGSILLGSPVPVIEMKKASLAKFELTHLDAFRMRGHLIALLPPKIGNM